MKNVPIKIQSPQGAYILVGTFELYDQNPMKPGAKDINNGLKMSTQSTEKAGYTIHAICA